MTWLAASALWQAFSGGNVLTRVLTALTHDIEAAWAWLSRDFWRLAFVAALIFGVCQFIALKAEQRHSGHLQDQLTASENARKADRDAYAKAQADAQAANKAQVTKVEQQYQRNSDDEREAYLRDLAKLRADRVRPQPPAPQGAAGSPDTPGPVAAAPRIDASGLCVPATSDVCEAGAEIELRLMHLQNLFEQQTKVDPNTK